MSFRIGIGYDVHVLKEGLDFTLGGVKLIHTKGCVAHSDGDVLIHAICDAMLGAANLRDIGFNYPDTDAEYKNVDSKLLLSKTYELLKARNYKLVNIDSVVSLQKPKIKDHIELMKRSISETLNVDIEDVSVKATTTEGLGFEGREEGVSAQAVVLICKEN